MFKQLDCCNLTSTGSSIDFHKLLKSRNGIDGYGMFLMQVFSGLIKNLIKFSKQNKKAGNFESNFAMQLLLAMPMILCWYCKEFLFLVMWVLQWESFCTGRTKNKFLLVIPTLSEHQHTLSPAEYQYTSTQTNIIVLCKTFLFSGPARAVRFKPGFLPVLADSCKWIFT